MYLEIQKCFILTRAYSSIKNKTCWNNLKKVTICNEALGTQIEKHESCKRPPQDWTFFVKRLKSLSWDMLWLLYAKCSSRHPTQQGAFQDLIKPLFFFFKSICVKSKLELHLGENGSSFTPMPNITLNRILRNKDVYNSLTSILRNSKSSRHILNLKNNC